jgi:hypothetical protein
MTSEAAVQQQIRTAAASAGLDLWRNQVGACEDKTGRVIRYGLMNDSKNLNARFKSSDLIGIRPILITADMVGQVVGVFSAIEAKASDWTYRPNDAHTQAQQRFINLVRAAGGMAGFARSPAEARAILRL